MRSWLDMICACVFAACGTAAPKPDVVATIEAQTLLVHTPTAFYGARTDGQIWRVDKTSRQLSTLIQTDVPADDLVSQGEDIYYSLASEENGAGRLFRLGSNTLLAPGLLRGSLRGDDGALYWIDRAAAALMRWQRQGTPDQLAVAGQADAPELAVDATHVYWFDPFAPGVIKRVSKTGGGIETVISGVIASQLQVDGDLIWYMQGDTLYSLRKTGGTPRDVVRGPSRFWALGGDVFYSIYDTRYGNEQALWMMRPDGTNRHSLVYDVGSLNLIQLVRDGDSIYWTNGLALTRLRF